MLQQFAAAAPSSAVSIDIHTTRNPSSCSTKDGELRCMRFTLLQLLLLLLLLLLLRLLRLLLLLL